MRSDRPMGITLIAAYYIIWGILALAGGLFGSVLGALLICFGPNLLTGSVWGIILGVLNLILGSSIWSGRDWAPTIVTLLTLVGLALSVIAGVSGSGWPWVNLIANAFTLFYIQSDGAKRFFATN